MAIAVLGVGGRDRDAHGPEGAYGRNEVQAGVGGGLSR
jgi:hypothetical protein